jgi:predicted PurR-regulated permease PerM
VGGPSSGPSSGPPWHRLHLWQMQPVRDVLVLLSVLGVVYVGYAARVVTVPVLLALALAYLFEPLVKLLTKRGLVTRRGSALGIIAAVGLLIVVPIVLGSGFAVVQAARAARVVSDRRGAGVAGQAR